MPIAERTVETTWEGSLNKGSGTLKTTSGALDNMPVSWASRVERPDGKTSPEELAAAAHSSCFSMALALVLGEKNLTPTRLTVGARVTLDAVNDVPTIVMSELRVEGEVPGTDRAGFDKLVQEAGKLCPISRLFAGARITIDTSFIDD